jgi:hypothetical protein
MTVGAFVYDETEAGPDILVLTVGVAFCLSPSIEAANIHEILGFLTLTQRVWLEILRLTKG